MTSSRPRPALALTRLSTKGRVELSEAIRVALGLTPGTRFVVLAAGDAVIFKRILVPPATRTPRALTGKMRNRVRQTSGRLPDGEAHRAPPAVGTTGYPS